MRTAKTRDAGFSMLELLAVMSIMALLTTVGVTSYFSAVRGMGRRNAIKHLANTLAVARQRASMDNSRVSVIIFNEVSGVDEDGKMIVRPSYVLCKEMGRITYVSGNALVDEFTALDAIFGLEKAAGDSERYQDFTSQAGGLKLYNLTAGGSSYVYPLVEEYQVRCFTVYDKEAPPSYHIAEGSRQPLDINNYSFRVNVGLQNNNATWNIGDVYGIEAGPVMNLPRGFEFSRLRDNRDSFDYVTFLPNGRAEFSAGSIRITELRPPNRSNTITVSQEGKIKYNNKW